MQTRTNQLAVAALALAPLSAFAAVDLTAITGITADVTAVGVAILGILLVIKGIKLMRRAL